MAIDSTKTDPLPEKRDTPANIPAAEGFAPSGAPQQITDFDPSHPAVDLNPREGTTLNQNRIDFNDPTIPGHEAVRRNLEAQGIDLASGAPSKVNAISPKPAPPAAQQPAATKS